MNIIYEFLVLFIRVIMVYLYYILLLLLNLAVICLVTRIKRSAENAEDILQNREKEYEAEKGRNLATKEDIAEITQKIEQVKSEVSFVNQWKHEHIFQREKRLIDILRKAETINHAIDEIILLSHNSNRFEKLYELIDKLNALIVDITIDGDMILVDYSKIINIDSVTNLVDNAVLYAKELSVLAHNVSDALSKEGKINDLSKNGVEIDSTMKLQIVAESQQRAKDLVFSELQYKKPTEQAIKDYIFWLKKLNDLDALSFYNVNEVLKEDKYK
jgi:hypothetical protein